MPVGALPWLTGGDTIFLLIFFNYFSFTDCPLIHDVLTSVLTPVVVLMICSCNLLLLNGILMLISKLAIAAVKEREKAQKAAQQKKGTSSSGYTTPASRAMSPIMSPVKSPRKAGGVTNSLKKQGDGTLSRRSSGGFDQRLLDIAALNLAPKEEPVRIDEPPPKMALEREKLLEEARKLIESSGKDKKSVSLVVIGRVMSFTSLTVSDEASGHVDAGKSTLMGRLLYELGRLDEKTRINNERGSSKLGKSSFSWAWGLDGTTEERERYGVYSLSYPCC